MFVSTGSLAVARTDLGRFENALELGCGPADGRSQHATAASCHRHCGIVLLQLEASLHVHVISKLLVPRDLLNFVYYLLYLSIILTS